MSVEGALMKVCEHCGTVNTNDANKCSACGALNFSYQCDNCGTKFSSAYCPSCGTKAGTKPQKCPDCGEEYNSAYCPKCGYSVARKANEKSNVPVQPNIIINQAPQQKKKTSFGIILLWILFLPIMGTIAIWKSQKLKTMWKVIFTAAIWIFILIYSIAGGGSTGTNNSVQADNALSASPRIETKAMLTDAPTTKPTATLTAKPTATPQPTDSTTLGERNALDKAYDYLSFTAFSYKGLIEQLEYEGFSHDEAIYGVDHCGADWNEQAALKAAQYLEYSSFSRSGLIDQLEFEGFTTEQVEYGVAQVGF